MCARGSLIREFMKQASYRGSSSVLLFERFSARLARSSWLHTSALAPYRVHCRHIAWCRAICMHSVLWSYRVFATFRPSWLHLPRFWSQIFGVAFSNGGISTRSVLVLRMALFSGPRYSVCHLGTEAKDLWSVVPTMWHLLPLDAYPFLEPLSITVAG